jgi:hypothetical protein
MTLSPQNAELRERSGSVNSKDLVVAFLYQILRDHLPAGTVEEIMQQHVLSPQVEEGDGTSEYCNGYIAQYAQDIANRLKIEPNEDKLWREVYARNTEEGRNRFIVSHVVNHNPDTISNPTYFILWEISHDQREAILLCKAPWQRILKFLKEEVPLSSPTQNS